MGQEIVYCSRCGHRILESDFTKGKAVTVLKRNYCPTCAKDVVEAGKKSPAAPESSSTPRSASLRKLEPRRSAPAEKSVPRGRSPIPLPYLLAIGIAVIAILLLIVVLSQKPPL